MGLSSAGMIKTITTGSCLISARVEAHGPVCCGEKRKLMSFPGDKGAQTALTEIYLNQDESSLIAETEEEEEKCHCGHCRVETRGGEMGVEGTRYTALYTTLYRLYRLYNSLHTASLQS